MFNTTEQSTDHMLIRPSLDERSRQAFAKHLRQFVFGPVRNAAGRAFRERVLPEHTARGAPPPDRKAARKALLGEPEYRFFSDLHRVSQELLWNAVTDTLDREAPRLRAEFRALAGPPARRGSLTLDPDLPVPRYLLAMDTHCMPGSYHTDRTADDLANGALYDRGSFLYAPSGGPRGDGAGHSSLAWYRSLLPSAQPARILDLGCGTAAPLLAWAEAFPGAELHGLDIGAPLLRFAHLRAGRLGLPLHLRQADAAATGYPDEYFDLVLSHIMFHETSAGAVPRILREGYRILKPGGAFLLLDLPDAGRIPDVFQQVVFDGDAHYNNEHFWMRMHDLDWPKLFSKAGFAPERIHLGATPMVAWAGSDQWVPLPFGYFAALAIK